jgi:mRNA interferase HicA
MTINTSEEQRVQTLAEGPGVNIQGGKGSHLKVTLNGRNSILAMYGKELGTGLVAPIKKQLGLN